MAKDRKTLYSLAFEYFAPSLTVGRAASATWPQEAGKWLSFWPMMRALARCISWVRRKAPLNAICTGALPKFRPLSTNRTAGKHMTVCLTHERLKSCNHSVTLQNYFVLRNKVSSFIAEEKVMKEPKQMVSLLSSSECPAWSRFRKNVSAAHCSGPSVPSTTRPSVQTFSMLFFTVEVMPHHSCIRLALIFPEQILHDQY